MSNHLFVVVSTGQNVANLPPLLEHAASGDRVVWVESAPARRAGWSRGAKAVLSRMGFVSLPDIVVEEIDDLGEMVQASRSTFDRAKEEQLAVRVILNGGTKLTPLGLLRAWGDLNPVLLYGEQQPAVSKTFACSLDRRAEIGAYTKHTLDLPEILEVSGHQFADDNQGVRFWPGPLADDLARERYGADEPYTVEWHRQLQLLNQAGLPGEEPPPYTSLPGLVPQRLEAWKCSLPALAGPHLRNLDNDGLFSNIYHATLKLAGDSALARCRSSLPLPPIGPAFERAVARRVHAWLEAAKHPAIHSAWRGVKVAERRSSHQATAEFDVLLVLKNGVLWHLECKSFTAANRDLDARLFNLQQAGSQLARMALCGPLFTDHVGEEWFPGQRDRRRLMEARRHLAFIPFTLPGQPGNYVVEEAGVSQTFACPTLEAALEGALRGYRPQT